MKSFDFNAKVKFVPPYDETFKPISLCNRAYAERLKQDETQEVSIALERGNGHVSLYETKVFSNKYERDNEIYIERLLKTLLWIKGGFRVKISCPTYIADYLKKAYCIGGTREFDALFMQRVYGEPFEIKHLQLEDMPKQAENPEPVGGNLDGYRIGFDAGGSDRKVSALVNGETVYSEEVVWSPKLAEDPQYQYDGILESMKTAASKMPRVDAIGISAAGIYIDNEVKAASLFMKVPDDLFESKVKRIFFDIVKEMGDVPFEVANDGDVTALAGAMSLNETGVLGIAMGTSEAGGYVDKSGYITGWLNELAFVPVDYSPSAMEDEWSGDIGCGVKYFSQDGVIKLAQNAGIVFDNGLSPAEKLKIIQKMMTEGSEIAKNIYISIGYYLGYALAYYTQFYEINQVLLLGRVTSGQGGNIIVEKAKEVLREEFPDLYEQMKISMPDEKARRVGQSVAAASLPKI